MPPTDSFIQIDHALTTRPAPSMAENESAHDAQIVQHAGLCAALRQLGVDVGIAAADPDFPQGCNIGDAAIVTGHLAVIGNFDHADPRQGEQKAASARLAAARFLKFVTPPGTLRAADAALIDGTWLVNISPATNAEGAAQAACFLNEFGHAAEVTRIETENDAPLSTLIADLGQGRVLIHPDIAAHYRFLDMDKIIAEEAEATGGFAVNGTFLLPASAQQTAKALQDRNIPVKPVACDALTAAGYALGTLVLRLPARRVSGFASLYGKRRTAA